jgi:hypothetical protein
MGCLLWKGSQEVLGALDVGCLGGFVAADEQQVEDLAAPREVDPIARSGVDPQLEDARTDRFRVAEVAEARGPRRARMRALPLSSFKARAKPRTRWSGGG